MDSFFPAPGEEIVKHSSSWIHFFQPQVKKWWVQLDISAPQIVIPESFQDPDTSMVMVDLGHLNFNNISTDKTPDSQTNTEGDFLF